MTLDEVRIEFQCSFVFAFGGAGIPIPVETGKRQGGVGSRRSLVEFHRLLCGGQRTGISLFRGHDTELTKQVVAVGQSSIGLGVARIFHDGLREIIDSLVEIFGSPLGPVILAFEI